MKELIIPNHVAIILDGNRRWAKEHGLSIKEGHKKGANNIVKITEHIFKKGIKVLSVFAFSTENFNRSKDEVDNLMSLFLSFFKSQGEKIKKENIKVIFSGNREQLSNSLVKAMEKLEKETVNNDYIFNICLNYGGQTEIIDAVKKIVKEKVDTNKLDNDTFKNYLYNQLPDIDLLIRTSGEQRISNFMLYQLAYAELFFIDTYWPAFTCQDFDLILNEYNNRNRKFGK